MHAETKIAVIIPKNQRPMTKKITILTMLVQFSAMTLTAQTFHNPLPPRVADACVAKFGNFYYMVGTPCPGDTQMQWVGIWKSRDLINWSGPYLAFEGEERDKPMWASEITRKGDEYYIITTCNMWFAGSTMMLQKAPTPLGPYTLHSHLKKKGLDPHLFVDTDGRSYLLDSEWIAPLNKEWNWLEGDFVGHRENKEGPFMVKNANRYLRFYARINDDYPMELETCDGDTPYTDDYQPRGIVYSGTFMPGHGCIVPSPDGTELWYASHYMTVDWEGRHLAIGGPMLFGDDGLPLPAIRRMEEQAVPSYAKKNTNIAVGKPVNSSEGNPLTACDGNTKTSWTCDTPTENSYIEVDLMGEYQIGTMHLDLGSDMKCAVLGSCDRINWERIGQVDVTGKRSATVKVAGTPAASKGGFCRYLRLTGFQAAPVSIAEWKVMPTDRHMAQPTGRHITILHSDTVAHMQKGNFIDLPSFSIPKTGRYDIVFHVASTASRHNRFTLYAGEQRIASESIAHTGVDDNWAQIIAFDTLLPAGDYEGIRFVADEGDFRLKEIELIELE